MYARYLHPASQSKRFSVDYSAFQPYPYPQTMALFTSQTAAEAARKSHAKGNTRQPSRRKQVSAIQNVLHDCVMTLQADLHSCEEPETRARVAMAISSSAKGWQSANAQERQLKGEPNVKPVDAPKADTSKTRKPAVPLEP